MNFALIGDDPAILPLIQQITDAPAHQLTHAVVVDPQLAERLPRTPPVVVVERWEDLLPIESIDAVIVCGSDKATIAASRQFVSNGRPILFLPRAAQGLEAIYELTLSRDESTASLIPIFFDRFDPQVAALKSFLDRNALGRILHLQVEAALAPADGSSDRALLSPEQVDERLLRDVELLRNLGGEYNQVTANHSKAGDSGLVMANVTLSAEGVPESSWSMKPTTGDPTWKLTIQGEIGSATLTADDGQDGRLQLAFGGENDETDIDDVDPTKSVALITHLERAIQGDSVRPNWTDLTRDFEIVEATHRSIARRRTIDLHFETTSERSVFKSQMTVAGCGLLVLTLFSLLGLLAAGALLDNRDPVQVNSESVGFVIDDGDFKPGSAKLTSSGRDHLASISKRLSQVPHSVLIAKGDDRELDNQRRDAVIARLQQSRSPNVERRTIIFELRGQTVSLLMRIARVVWVIPLVLFLTLQILLFVAKPSSERGSQQERDSQ